MSSSVAGSNTSHFTEAARKKQIMDARMEKEWKLFPAFISKTRMTFSRLVSIII